MRSRQSAMPELSPKAVMAKCPYSEVRAEMLARAALNGDHVEANLVAAGLIGGVELRSVENSDSFLLVTLDTMHPGEWRVTGFDGHGPYGHHLFASREIAIRAASGESFSKFVNGPRYYRPQEFKVAATCVPQPATS